MTRDEFEAYINAFNRDDFDGFSKYYADDVEFNLGDRKQIIGRKGIVEFYRGVKEHFREELTIIDLVITPTRIALHNGTVFSTIKDWPDFELWPTMDGDVRRIESINLYELENDKFTRIKSARYKQL
jgi:hypothetical protein